MNMQNLGKEVSLAITILHAAWLSVACSEIRIAPSVTSVECESSRITTGYAAFCSASQRLKCHGVQKMLENKQDSEMSTVRSAFGLSMQSTHDSHRSRMACLLIPPPAAGVKITS